jgi:2-hydroxy-6-oxonona-2,4-dienedioate hydrolase
MQNPQDKYIKVNNENIRYWDEGDSDSILVLVHGFAANVEYWEKNIWVLAKKRRVIAVDLIGFGKSDKPKINYTLELFVDFLKSFLKELNIDKLDLMGHSMGGGVSTYFASKYPDKVNKLFLISSVGFDKYIPMAFRVLGLPIWGKLIFQPTRYTVGQAVRRFMYVKDSISEEFAENLYQLNKTKAAKYSLLKILTNYVSLKGISNKILKLMKERVAKLTMPVYVVWGKQDELLSVRGAAKAKELIPQAKVYLFDKCGHMPQLEYPAKFNELICSFLSA